VAVTTELVYRSQQLILRSGVLTFAKPHAREWRVLASQPTEAVEKSLRFGWCVGSSNILSHSAERRNSLCKIGYLQAIILLAQWSHCLLAKFFNSLDRF
jgi:hypothetical protein